MKEMFVLEEEGEAQVASDEQSQNMLQEFVNYVKVSVVLRVPLNLKLIQTFEFTVEAL